jgi:hypothetical protein
VINKLQHVMKMKLDQHERIGEDEDENRLTERELLEEKPFTINLQDEEDERKS